MIFLAKPVADEGRHGDGCKFSRSPAQGPKSWRVTLLRGNAGPGNGCFEHRAGNLAAPAHRHEGPPSGARGSTGRRGARGAQPRHLAPGRTLTVPTAGNRGCLRHQNVLRAVLLSELCFSFITAAYTHTPAFLALLERAGQPQGRPHIRTEWALAAAACCVAVARAAALAPEPALSRSPAAAAGPAAGAPDRRTALLCVLLSLPCGRATLWL